MPSKVFHFGQRIFHCLIIATLHFENFNATFHNLKFHLLTPTLIDSHPFDSPPRELAPWKPWAPWSSEARLATPSSRKGSFAVGEGKASALPDGDQISVLTVNKPYYLSFQVPGFTGWTKVLKFTAKCKCPRTLRCAGLVWAERAAGRWLCTQEPRASYGYVSRLQNWPRTVELGNPKVSNFTADLKEGQFSDPQ